MTFDPPAASIGACCPPNSSCGYVLAPGAACADFRGAGSACAADTCPAPTAACCHPDVKATCDVRTNADAKYVHSTLFKFVPPKGVKVIVPQAQNGPAPGGIQFGPLPLFARRTANVPSLGRSKRFRRQRRCAR